jgi:hypothetical protein
MMTKQIELLKQEIKMLQSKLSFLEEIERHNAKPKMHLENEGEFGIVSYNDEIYYRLEYPTAIIWYKRKDGFSNDMMLVLILDLETHRLLEDMWNNQVLTQKDDEPYCPDEPEYYDEIEHDISENVENKTIKEVINRWWMDTFTSKNQWNVDTCIDDLADQVEFWILRNKK